MSSPADIERLLRHTDWLRELARSILRERAAADDVVQDVWVAALERAPHAADERGLRAWLAEVARNLARARLRQGARRERRELAAARPERVDSIASALERVGTQRALVEAVLALEPADREVVVLRYFEGLAPRQIARRLGTTSPAVRSRLSRALAKLRGRLEGEVDARALVLLALSPPRGGALVSWIGGTLVTKAILIAVAAGALLGTWIYVREDAPEPARVASAPLVEDARPAASGAEVGPTAREEDAARVADVPRGPAASVEAASRTTEGSPRAQLVLQARIVDRDGEPIAGALLTAVDLLEPRSAESDAGGRVRLALDWPRELAYGNERWAFSTASLEGWTTLRLQTRTSGPGVVELGELALEPGGAISGRVVDASGAPVAGAQLIVAAAALPGTPEVEEERRVRALHFTSVWSPLPRGDRTEADGSYLLEGVPARALSVVAHLQGSYYEYTPPVEVPAGGAARAPDLVLRPVEPRNAIRGVVLDEAGPVAGAEVQAFESRGARNVNPQAGPTRSDAEGRFELVVLTGSVHTLEVTYPKAPSRQLVLDDVRAGELALRLVFPPERTIRVEVVDAAGAPIEGAILQLYEHPSRWGLVTRPRPADGGGLELALPTGTFGLSVFAQGHVARALGPFEPATAPDPLVVELARAEALRGRVTAGGEPVAGARVHAHAPPRGSELASFDCDLLTRWDPHEGQPATVDTDAAGRFELFPFGDGPFLLHAEAPGFARAEAGPVERASFDGLHDLELRLAPGATLAGRLLVAPGVSTAGTLVVISRADGHVDSFALDESGRYRFEHLAPGRWQVRRCDASQARMLGEYARPVRGAADEAEHDLELREGEAREHDLDLRHELPLTLTGRLALDGGWSDGWAAMLGRGAEWASGRRVAADGTYRLTLAGEGDARLVFAVSSATGGHVQLASPALALASGEHRVDWSAQTGAVDLAALPPSGPGHEPGMPGYALVRTDEAGWTWTRWFEPDAAGSLACEAVPAGSVELRRRESPHQQVPEQWPVLATIEVPAGGRVTFAPPAGR